MKKWEPIINEPKIINYTKDRINNIFESVIQKTDKINDLSLYTGVMGHCLFMYYYSLVNRNNNEWKDLYYSINDRISNLSTNDNYSIACNINFVWFTSHLNKSNALKVDLDSFFYEYDNLLKELMLKYIKSNNYDLLYGATQLATYFLNRYKNNPSHYRPFIDDFILCIYKQADIIDNHFFTWKSIIDRDNPNELGYNLGLAHGIPSLLMFFAKLKNFGIQNSFLDEMIINTSNYLLSKIQDVSLYKSYYGVRLKLKEDKMEMSRIGWCYGDLGVGYSMLHASLYTPKDLNLQAKSNEILKYTIKKKSQSETLIVDNCLCHGTIGVALMYDRLYKITSDPIYRESSIYWYEKTIMEPFSDNYAAGYKIFKGHNQYDSDFSFLSGISGIGLGLLSSIYPHSPNWTEFILLS